MAMLPASTAEDGPQTEVTARWHEWAGELSQLFG